MINNLGSLIFFYITYPFLILLYKVLCIFQNSAKCFMKAKNRLKKKIFWGMFLVGVLETYAILVLCCNVALGHLDFRSWGLVIQSLACFVYAFIIIFMPVFIIRLFTKSFEDLTNKNMTNRYGLLYDNLEISRGPKIYLQPLWFLIRRIILGFSVTWTSDLLIVQIYLIST